jgi:hypothetical protein
MAETTYRICLKEEPCNLQKQSDFKNEKRCGLSGNGKCINQGFQVINSDKPFEVIVDIIEGRRKWRD